MHQPLKVLRELERWKNPQTILMCYQHPDQEQLSTPVENFPFVAGENCTLGRGDEPQDVWVSFRVLRRLF